MNLRDEIFLALRCGSECDSLNCNPTDKKHLNACSAYREYIKKCEAKNQEATKTVYSEAYKQAEADILSEISNVDTVCCWCIDKNEKIGYEKGYKEGIKEFAKFIKSRMGEREYMGIKYKQGVFSDNDIDEFAERFGVEVDNE